MVVATKEETPWLIYYSGPDLPNPQMRGYTISSLSEMESIPLPRLFEDRGSRTWLKPGFTIPSVLRLSLVRLLGSRYMKACPEGPVPLLMK